MKLSLAVKFAMRSVRRTPLRSGLTILGVIIGVATVVTMVSIGSGAKARVEASFANLDSNQLALSAYMARDEFGRWRPMPVGDGLNVEDYHAVRSEISDLMAVSPMLNIAAGTDSTVKARGRTSPARIVGMDVDGFKLESRRLVFGATFGSADVHDAASICVISQFVAQTLFPGESPVGGLLHIQDVPFRIVGVLTDRKSITESGRPGAEDTQVSVPYTSLLLRLDRGANLRMRIAMRVRDLALVDRVEQDVANLMERRRGARKAQFKISKTVETIETYTRNSRTLALLLSTISAISLLIGGIGIMNIMLITVTERTREIGIRVAVGARTSDVLQQFLVEAVVQSLFGGAIGILLGMGVAQVLSQWNDWPLLITPGAIAVALICSVGIGAFFGYYPARRAANLSPILALRAD